MRTPLLLLENMVWLLLLILFGCKNDSKDVNKNKPFYAEIIGVEIRNIDTPFYHGHLPFYRVHMRLTNNSKNSYLFCCSKEDYFLLVDKGKVFDTVRYEYPMLLKPRIVDTVSIAKTIFVPRSEVDSDQYLFASIKYHGGNQCDISEISNRYFEGTINIETTYLGDDFQVKGSKEARKRIDNRVIN